MRPEFDADGLRAALDLLLAGGGPNGAELPTSLPEFRSRAIGSTRHVEWSDPRWWTASCNQNLLHPDSAPVARDLERFVVDWLAPAFGMTGGHMMPGSSVGAAVSWRVGVRRGVLGRGG